MFKWLFKLFGYVPVEELNEMREFMQEVADKATLAKDSKSTSMDASTLFGAMIAEGSKPQNELGAWGIRDTDGDSVRADKPSSLLNVGKDNTHQFVILNVDIPAYKGGPIGELWLMYSVGHNIEDIRLSTCCWERTVY